MYTFHSYLFPLLRVHVVLAVQLIQCPLLCQAHIANELAHTSSLIHLIDSLYLKKECYVGSLLLLDLGGNLVMQILSPSL